MGRWAQRRVSGGGSPSIGTIVILSAHITGTHTATIELNAGVDAAGLTATDFESDPSAVNPTSLAQLTDTSIELNFSILDVISADTELAYFGSTPLAPNQTVLYT